jgi:hypothetical protein
MHLSQLTAGGFLHVAQQGRQRYYRIAKPEVAHAIEALGVISTVEKYRPSGTNQALCYARTCYDHLAGELAVQMTAALERNGVIVAHGERDYELTPRGEDFFDKWKIDTNALRQLRRNFARRCLDWTERRDHLAGSLGAAICQRLLEFRWIIRDRRSRSVSVSASGRQQLARLLQMPRI